MDSSPITLRWSGGMVFLVMLEYCLTRTEASILNKLRLQKKENFKHVFAETEVCANKNTAQTMQ